MTKAMSKRRTDAIGDVIKSFAVEAEYLRETQG